MKAVKAYYDGQAFIPLTPVTAVKNQAAIVTILDDFEKKGRAKAYLRYAGALSNENCAELTEILKDTQKVDSDEW
jgi:hypothetical protein